MTTSSSESTVSLSYASTLSSSQEHRPPPPSRQKIPRGERRRRRQRSTFDDDNDTNFTVTNRSDVNYFIRIGKSLSRGNTISWTELNAFWNSVDYRTVGISVPLKLLSRVNDCSSANERRLLSNLVYILRAHHEESHRVALLHKQRTS